MAVYRIWLDRERASDKQEALYHLDNTRIDLLKALMERCPTAGISPPVMDMYLVMAIPPLNTDDMAYVESNVGLPLHFHEVGRSR